jgi:hypothetical protein
MNWQEPSFAKGAKAAARPCREECERGAVSNVTLAQARE